MLGFPIPLAQGVINHLPSLWVEWQHICHPCPVSMTQMTHICLFPSPLCYIKCELFVSYFPLLQLYFGVFVAAAVFHGSHVVLSALLTPTCSSLSKQLTYSFYLATGSSEIAPVTESFIMQETRKLSALKVSKGISVWYCIMTWSTLELPVLWTLIIWFCWLTRRKLIASQGKAKHNYNRSIPFYSHQTILEGRRCYSAGH